MLPLRLHFDRPLKFEFHGSRITSDARLLAYRELNDALNLPALSQLDLTGPIESKLANAGLIES